MIAFIGSNWPFLRSITAYLENFAMFVSQEVLDMFLKLFT